jgi:hypothetical protein
VSITPSIVLSQTSTEHQIAAWSVTRDSHWRVGAVLQYWHLCCDEYKKRCGGLG